jgi:hypothetical protein
LGNCYQRGRGVTKDFIKANNGCENGLGTDKDYNKAFELYSKSASNGCAKSQYNLHSKVSKYTDDPLGYLFNGYTDNGS